jgi:hypothetical protein
MWRSFNNRKSTNTELWHRTVRRYVSALMIMGEKTEIRSEGIGFLEIL